MIVITCVCRLHNQSCSKSLTKNFVLSFSVSNSFMNFKIHHIPFCSFMYLQLPCVSRKFDTVASLSNPSIPIFVIFMDFMNIYWSAPWVFAYIFHVMFIMFSSIGDSMHDFPRSRKSPNCLTHPSLIDLKTPRPDCSKFSDEPFSYLC